MFARSGTADLAYDVEGSPAGGADVLLVHAGVTDRRSWRPLLDRIAVGRRCVSYDARGFGETTYEPEDYASHQDALAVMDAAGLAAPVVVGASMGGRTAINLALEHPTRVRALVLIGPAISGAPQTEIDPEPIATFWRKLEEAEHDDDLDEVNRLEAHVWLDGPTAREGRVGGEVRELFLEMNGHALRAVDPGDDPHPVQAWPRLEELTKPILVIVGSLDLPDIKDPAGALSQRAPDGRLVMLDGVAHLPHLEGDVRCLDAVAEFLRELDQ